MNYEEQLKTEEWKEKRMTIIYRDMGMCQHCMSSKNLDVHHKYYLEGKKAWEYPDAALLTLCRSCHENVHKWHKVPTKQTSLDIALERLVSVAKNVRSFCQSALPKDDGKAA